MRLVSVGHLLDPLEAGEVVFIAGSAGEPQELTDGLVQHPDRAAGVRFITTFVPGINGRNLAAAGTSRSMDVFFMQDAYRDAHAAGRITFHALGYFAIHQYLSRPDTRIDAAVVQVSEPDAEGACSLGPAVEFMPTVLRKARRVFGVINRNVPVLRGSPTVRMEQFDRMARSDAPLAEYDAGGSQPAIDRIVAYLAQLIPDGATVQVGLGKVPAGLIPALRSHRDLALHSGMLSDGLPDLAGCGGLRAGASLTTTVVVGRRSLYARLPGIGGLHLAEVAYTHSPETLRQVPRLHAINSAIEVDLLGRINAETIAGRPVSGPGGLPDFARAAHRQPDGLSVIALPSTDPTGRRSRIVAEFSPGTAVTVPASEVDAVVTEHGIARLRGAAPDERLQRLIEIAHPDHRPALRDAAPRGRGPREPEYRM